jgi:hypothetical protein
MIASPDWQEPTFTDEQLDRIERKGLVTMTEFCAVLGRGLKRMKPEQKAELRRAVMEDMLLKMKPATQRIQ